MRDISGTESAVPAGLIPAPADPALKRRAILGCPFGTGKHRGLSADNPDFAASLRINPWNLPEGFLLIVCNPMKTSLKTGLLALAIVSSMPCALRAALFANGQISSVPNGGSYDYTITLNNPAGPNSSIQTFWFSWVPGADFLPSMPFNIQAPAGWVGYVMGGPYYDPYYGYYYPDGYSIEFYTTTTPLLPGSSKQFKFTSPDSPTVLAGTSPLFPPNLIRTSYVYDSPYGSGTGVQFVVAVPEPSSLAVLAVGSFGWLALQRVRGRNNARKSVG